MRAFSLLTAATAAVLAAGCGGSTAERAAQEPTTLPATVTVSADTLPTTFAAEGTVRARLRADISTRMMARVTEIPVEIGTRVRHGQTLIRLGLDDVTASRAKADAAVTMARAARDEAARQAARMDTLHAEDVVSRVQRDQARLGATQAESQLAMAEATLQEVETAAGYARITAPFDGVVVDRAVDPGDLAAPGMPLLVVESNGPREVVLAVAPEVAAQLRSGAAVEVVARDGRRTDGVVRAVSGGADPQTRTVEVRVEVPSDWPTGVSVTALIPTGTRVAVTVPASAVVRRGQLTGVRVVSGDGVVLRWVRLGRSVGDRIEVLSGLEAGERIAL
ncbi:MAG: efflux RND transporter periplasmic adaptor subunit [Gemmatimonadota bacterium]|nr:efflux RND transporter periplasmic adaptor subunit [Gemmatimonadota bacterium]